MIMRHTFEKLFSVLLLGVFSLHLALGQEESTRVSSPAALQTMKLNAQWFQGNNTAGLSINPLRDYSKLFASYTHEYGDFHPAMEGSKVGNLHFGAEGSKALHGFNVWASFNYDRQVKKEAGYNASIIHPYRGMPYYVVDSNLSDWNNQYYQLDFKVASPMIADKVALGVQGGYDTYLGAKQRDIRSENYAMNLFVMPSLAYKINDAHAFGLNFRYAAYKEESTMSNVNYYINQPYFELFGMGFATKRIGSGRTTDYKANTLGGGVQYQFNGAIRAFIEGNYELRVEDAVIGFSQPRDIGTIKNSRWNVALNIQKEVGVNSHYLSARFESSSSAGIQYITKFDDTDSFQGFESLLRNIRSRFIDNKLDLSYIWLRNYQDEYTWLLEAKGGILQRRAKYLIPYSEKIADVAFTSIEGRRNLILDEKKGQRLELSLLAGFQWKTKNSISLNEEATEEFVTKNIEIPDHLYLGTNFISSRASVEYAQIVNQKNQMKLFVKGEYQLCKPMNSTYKNRSACAVTLGCIF